MVTRSVDQVCQCYRSVEYHDLRFSGCTGRRGESASCEAAEAVTSGAYGGPKQWKDRHTYYMCKRVWKRHIWEMTVGADAAI